VEHAPGLLLDGGDDRGMAVTGRRDRDAALQVEEPVAVHVLDHAPSARRGTSGYTPRHRWARHGQVLLDDAPGLRAWQLGHELRAAGVGQRLHEWSVILLLYDRPALLPQVLLQVVRPPPAFPPLPDPFQPPKGCTPATRPSSHPARRLT
jgi:hypothetical protein